MNTQEQPASLFERIKNSITNSVTFKLIVIGILIGIMLIPANMIENLIRERRYNSQDVAQEVASKWGKPQTIIGPVITVPYKEYYYQEKKKFIRTKYAHFLPNTLTIKGEITPSLRKRSIYEVSLYNTAIQINGNFSPIAFNQWNIPSENVNWNEAFVSIGIDDLNGIQKDIIITSNSETYRMDPGIPISEVFSTGVSKRINIQDSIPISFSFDLNINGSNSLQFCPIGKNTNVHVESSWKDPKFSGHFLPDERSVSENGFTATWNILDLNRNFPQKWIGASHKISTTTFGVDLLTPIDHYQKNTRSAKYSSLILLLTFLTFFFVEILNKKKIHSIQYIMVGLSLSTFYLLLLSLSEHLGFNRAYAISALVIIFMITLYTSTILKNRMLTIYMFAFFTLIYGFIFTILQLQDFALLVGSIGLTMVLGLSMFLSRKVDWYNLNKR